MPTHKHVLIVDEDREARAALAGQLERHGYRVTTASSGGGMQRALERARIDLVMLDVHFSEEDGMRLCRSLRAASDVPFIILARRADEVDRILGLEMGADDYLAKPVNFRELLARMRNILRRANASAAAPATRAQAVSLRRLAARHRGARTRESARRARSACAIPNIACSRRCSRMATASSSRDKLIELARGRDAGPFDRSIDVRISRLRQVLGDDARVPRIIKTVHGEGYVIGVLVERA